MSHNLHAAIHYWNTIIVMLWPMVNIFCYHRDWREKKKLIFECGSCNLHILQSLNFYVVDIFFSVLFSFLALCLSFGFCFGVTEFLSMSCCPITIIVLCMVWISVIDYATQFGLCTTLTQRSCKNVNIYLGLFLCACFWLFARFSAVRMEMLIVVVHIWSKRRAKKKHRPNINVKKQVKKSLICLSFTPTSIDSSSIEIILFFFCSKNFVARGENRSLSNR